MNPDLIKKVRRTLYKLLVTSLNTEQMNDLGRSVDREFNVYEFSGFGEKIVVPRKVAADCIVQNFDSPDRLVDFIAYMISRNGHGASGGVIRLKGHEKILSLLEEEHLKYDSENARFIKDQSSGHSEDWGFMKPGQEYPMSFVSIDIVSSSELVRTNVKDDVEITIGRLKQYVKSYVENWEGRLWYWYGDGGMAAFQGKDSVPMSTLSMIALLVNLPVFNIVENELRSENDIKLRVGIHYGTAIFKEDLNQITSLDMKIAQEIEKHMANANSLAVSDAVFTMLPQEIRRHFENCGDLQGMRMFRYTPT